MVKVFQFFDSNTDFLYVHLYVYLNNKKKKTFREFFLLLLAVILRFEISFVHISTPNDHMHMYFLIPGNLSFIFEYCYSENV